MKLNSSDKFESAVLLIIALFFLFLIAILLSGRVLVRTQTNGSVKPATSGPPENFRWLDGQPVAADQISLKPVAIVLENHFESRPVSGLEYASVIYETVVEGDITRFLAIFDSSIKAKKIGPVRSVRPFFVELAEEWNAVLFHAGGSQDAMYKLTYSPVYNVNEISGDGIYFWRDKNRTPPHNLYTSADLVSRAMAAKEIDPAADFLPWLFKDDLDQKINKSINQDSGNIKIDFLGNPLYQVEYQYNPATNDYTRYLAGQVHKTDQGIVLKAKNVVVQHVKSKVLDDYGRLSINLQNGGLAEIYQDGQRIDGRWKKVGYRTRFYDQKNDKEVEFNRGVIWVELVFD